MSPFCRQCYGIARPNEIRCPLDNEFFATRECPGCGEEVFPRELFCGFCGFAIHEVTEAILLPAEATRFRIWAGYFLDVLAIVLLVCFQFWSLPAGWLVLLTFATFLSYRSLGRAQGRQTLGQAVFQSLTVSFEAGPASLQSSIKRSLSELWVLPLSILKGEQFLRELDGLSSTYEVRLG